MNIPKVTVITVCYNAESIIERTIESVVNQTYSNIEYIVVDGKSTDGTMEIVNKYSDKIDKLISEPDHGIFDAMNKGIKLATGDWINFMNAGDCFYDNEVLSNYIPQIKEDTIVAYANMIAEHKYYKYEYLNAPLDLNVLAIRSIVPHQAVLIRASYQKEHLFNPVYKAAGDYELFYNAFLRDKCKFQYVPIIAVDFDATGGVSHNALLMDVECASVRGEHLNQFNKVVIKIKQRIRSLLPENYLERRKFNDIKRKGKIITYK